MSSAPALSPAATAILRRGTIMLDAKQFSEAMLVFQEYSQRYPTDPRGYFWTAVCLDEMDKLQESCHFYQQSLSKAEQMGMDSSELRTNLGNVLLKQNNVQGAIEQFQKALEVNPQLIVARLNLGRAFLESKDYNAALLCFDKCNEQHFKGQQLNYYRAKTYLGLGRNAEAASIARGLLQELPEGKSKEKMQAEFRTLLQN